MPVVAALCAALRCCACCRQVCHYAFGVLFLAVRILVGIPVSVFWFSEMVQLVAGGAAKHPAIAVVYMVLNVLLNGLNLLWFTIMLRKALGPPDDPVPGAKAAAAVGGKRD